MKKKLSLKDVFLNEFGKGDPQGASTFQGTGNFGIGNGRQLATTLNPATKRLEDMEQAELNQNVRDLQWSLGKYGNGHGPETGSTTGPVGPNEPTQANYNRGVGRTPTAAMQDIQVSGDPYGGMEEEEELEEQAPSGAQYGAREPSDGRYRDLPGWPPMDTLETDVDWVPSDRDAEMAAYYQDQEENYEERLKDLEAHPDQYLEQMQPYRPMDHFRANVSGIGRADNSEMLVAPEDHLEQEPADYTPQNVGGKGAVIAPKKFVPDDTEVMDMEDLHEMIDRLVREALSEAVREPTPAFTGIHDDTGDGEPVGGSAAFRKSREEVITDLEKPDSGNKLGKKKDD